MPNDQTLPLTAFERYQFWETQPGHPNQIAAVFDFEGQIRTDIFLEAVDLVQRRHPLFWSKIEMSGDRPVRWKLDPAQKVPVVLLPVAAPLDFDALPTLPTIHPSFEPAGRLTVRYDSESRCQWILQTHHSHCDGVGGLQIIRELMQVYHQLCEGDRGQLKLRPLSDERLRKRDQWEMQWEHWWKKPLQVLGLFGASKFLLRSPLDLSKLGSQQGENTSESQQTTDQDVSFCAADHQLSVSQSKRLRQLAKESEVTVNSLILAYWMLALQQWASQHQASSEKDWFRLVIPTNERNLSDLNLSACNRVSLVYVDRQVREFEYPEALMKGIHYEMGVMRNLNLTRTMLLALRIMNWIPGVLRRHARTPRCWATSYVTNLGGAMDRLNVPLNQDRESMVGQLTMKRIRLLPPLRPGTPIALAVNVYARKFGFTVHADQRYLNADDAQQILRYFLNRILTLS